MKVTFDRHLPLSWRTRADELKWYLNNVRLDGRPITRQQLSDISLTSFPRVGNWLASVSDRRKRRAEGAKINDPPIRVIRLLRLEFGVEEPLCRENS